MALNGPFQVDDQVQLTDSKNRHFTVILEEGGKLFTHCGTILHDDLTGAKEGTTVTSDEGTVYLAMRRLLVDYVLSVPHGATVICPRDAARIIAKGDIFPDACVLEAGAGSSALSLNLLRTIGANKQLVSYEVRKDHIEHAERNVADFMGHEPDNWDLRLGDLNETPVESPDGPVDRVILDTPAPWECLDTVSKVLRPDGVLMIYVATIPQLMKVMEGIRAQKCFTKPRAWESLAWDWNVQDFSIHPAHRMQVHTAFLVWARRLADNTVSPCPQRRNRKKLQSCHFALGGAAVVKCDATHGLNRPSNDGIWPYG